MNNYYVYSTLSSDNIYTSYHKQEVSVVAGKEPRVTNAPLIESQITIKGGANVAPAGIRRLETPLGVVTEVTEDELELLESNEVFQTHKKNGFISIRKKKVNPEVAVADMQTRDDSSPLTEADMAKAEPDEKEKVKPTGRFDKKDVKNKIK